MKTPKPGQQYKHITGSIITIVCVTNYYEKNHSIAIVYTCVSGNTHSRCFSGFKSDYVLIK